MGHYTIKDLVKLSGIKAHTIRIWEKRYSLIEPKRTSTNIRTYCDDELKKLLNISILNRNGYKISKIARLSANEIKDEINQLIENSDDIDSHIENLAIAMIELDESKFEKILSRLILQLGFEEMVIRILFPFFVRIGVMWQTGTINPYQEHFISNLVRQKLIVAIDGVFLNENDNPKSFLLFLPEGEWHEMALLFYSYLVKKHGHKLVYLGQSVPYNGISEVIKRKKIDFLLTSFVGGISKPKLSELVQQMSDAFTEQQILISGAQNKQLEQEHVPDNVALIYSPKELLELF